MAETLIFNPRGTLEVEIPDLGKIKDKERRGAGVPLPALGVGSAQFIGAQGGVGAHMVLESLSTSGAGGVFCSVLARLTAAGLPGGLVARLAAAVIVLGGGLLAYWSVIGAQAPVQPAADLGGISSDIKVERRSLPTALAYAKGSSRGEIKFAKTFQEVAREEAVESDKDAVAGGDMKEGGIESVGPSENKGFVDRLPHDLRGAKLTSSIGGEFGGKNIFDGASPRFGDTFDRGRLNGFRKGNREAGARGGVSTSRALLSSGRRGSIGGSDRNIRALAQLRTMSPLNRVIMGDSGRLEVNADAARAQFEGTVVEGSKPPITPFDGEGRGEVVDSERVGGGRFAGSCSPEQLDRGMINGSGGCGEGSGASGKDKNRDWTGRVDRVRDLVDRAITWLTVSAAAFWLLIKKAKKYLRHKLMKWLGILLLKLALIISVFTAGYVYKIGMDISAKGDEINALGGKPIGNMVGRIGNDVKRGSWYCFAVPIVGPLYIAGKIMGREDKLRREVNLKIARDMIEGLGGAEGLDNAAGLAGEDAMDGGGPSGKEDPDPPSA